MKKILLLIFALPFFCLSVYAKVDKKVESKNENTLTARGEIKSGDVTFGNGNDKLTIGTSGGETLKLKDTQLKDNKKNKSGTHSSDDELSSKKSGSIGFSHKDGSRTVSGKLEFESSDGSKSSGSGVGLDMGDKQTATRKNADGSETTISYEEGTKIKTSEKSDDTSEASVRFRRNAKAERTHQYGDKNGTGAKTTISAETKNEIERKAGISDNGLEVSIGGTSSVEAKAKVEGQLGTDKFNVHGSGEIKVSEELSGTLKGIAKVDPDGSIVLKGEVGGGWKVGVDGTLTGGITLMGVPVDVEISGGASIGLEASASAGAKYDAKTGKVKFNLEASAVFGAGVSGSITVEVGVAQLGNIPEYMVDKVVTAMVGGDQTEYIQDLLNSSTWEEGFVKIANHELEDASVTVDSGTLLGMIKSGAETGDVFRYIEALKEDDMDDAFRILTKIQKDIHNARDAKDASPLDADPGASQTSDDANGNNSSTKSKPVGLTPFKVY